MANPKEIWPVLREWTKRVAKILLGTLAIYVTVLLIGLVPVNNDFQPDPNGIRVYLVSNAVHADMIVPKSSSVVDWTQKFDSEPFGLAFHDESHVAFGWGDRGFFLETETWEDLNISTAANALLLPSKTCVHVAFTNPDYYTNAVSVSISENQYQALVDHIEQTMKKDHLGRFIQIPGYSYSYNDAFFDACGRYHLFNTCNSWIGRGLKSSGVRVPWLTPMPKSPMIYLSNDNE